MITHAIVLFDNKFRTILIYELNKTKNSDVRIYFRTNPIYMEIRVQTRLIYNQMNIYMYIIKLTRHLPSSYLDHKEGFWFFSAICIGLDYLLYTCDPVYIF